MTLTHKWSKTRIVRADLLQHVFVIFAQNIGIWFGVEVNTLGQFFKVHTQIIHEAANFFRAAIPGRSICQSLLLFKRKIIGGCSYSIVINRTSTTYCSFNQISEPFEYHTKPEVQIPNFSTIVQYSVFIF